MVPPSPYPSRDVGDPQVTRSLRSVVRSPFRHFSLASELAPVQAVRMSQFFHTHHRIWAMSPSHWTADFRHDWGLSNAALTIDGLAAGPLACGVKASPGFSHHAIVHPLLSVWG
jgi:hypothetical protein